MPALTTQMPHGYFPPSHRLEHGFIFVPHCGSDLQSPVDVQCLRDAGRLCCRFRNPLQHWQASLITGLQEEEQRLLTSKGGQWQVSASEVPGTRGEEGRLLAEKRETVLTM